MGGIKSSGLSLVVVFIATIVFSTFLMSMPVTAAIDGDLRLNIGVFDEGKMIPFYSGFASVPVHPGGILGAELTYREKRHHTLFQTLNFGYYYHRRYEHGLFVNTELGYRYVGSLGFFVEALIGAGYLHTFIDGETYKFNASAGQYEKIAYGGRSHAMVPILTIGGGIDLSGYEILKSALYFRYQAFLDMPHCLEQGVLVMTHTAFYIGFLFNIGSIKR